MVCIKRNIMSDELIFERLEKKNKKYTKRVDIKIKNDIILWEMYI